MTRQRRQANVLAVLTLVMTVGILILAATALPAVFEGRDNTAAVQRGNDLAACRSEARSLIDDANKNISLLIIRGLRATAEGDDEQLAAIVAESRQAERALIDATAAYRRAVRESVAHPSRFLEECRR